eukprot:4567306-Alexandrium_andersonii.AAC.1
MARPGLLVEHAGTATLDIVVPGSLPCWVVFRTMASLVSLAHLPAHPTLEGYERAIMRHASVSHHLAE